MKSLPPEIRKLKAIRNVLDKLMADSGTAIEINAKELYHHVIKDPELKSELPNAIDFSRFLRKQHDQGIMKQFIPYRVDTFNKQRYQWYFSRSTNLSLQQNSAKSLKSDFNYYKQSKTVKCLNGELVNSEQERLIYEALLGCRELTVRHDHPLTHDGETKFVDFFIINKFNKTTFYWEHFGMTNSEKYKDQIPDKLNWYRINGYKFIEDGGTLITTYYSSANDLNKEIEFHINLIKKATKII